MALLESVTPSELWRPILTLAHATPSTFTPRVEAIEYVIADDGSGHTLPRLTLSLSDATSPLPTLDSTRLLARAALTWSVTG